MYNVFWTDTTDIVLVYKAMLMKSFYQDFEKHSLCIFANIKLWGVICSDRQ